MKADAGNWLYIILSLVFIALSLVGNKDKKKQASSPRPVDDDYEPTVQPSERQWPKSLEDVLTEVLDMPKQPKVVTEKPQPWMREDVLEKPQNSYEKIEEEAQSLETIEDETFSYETPVELSKTKLKTVETPKSIEKSEEKEPKLVFDNFDLKQGIIYSEILNRKYF